MDITYRLSKFIVDTRLNDIPENVRNHAKLCILDWLGSALAGSKTDVADIVASILNYSIDHEESSIIGMCRKTSCLYASLVNGVSGHALEMDDIHEKAIIHPAAPVLPASLAVGEKLNLGGEDLILAVILGYETEIRLGIALNPSHYRFWHTTGTCGTFGSTASVGKLLNLDLKPMMNAFGIAGTLASGVTYVFGTMAKPLNPGIASMNGVLAGLLAMRGLKTLEDSLDIEYSYLNAVSEGFDPGIIIDGLGVNYEILNNIFKVHASCGHTHAAIDATLDIIKRYGVESDDIKEVLVGVYPIALDKVGGINYPKTPEEGKFSLTYCIASAILYKRVGIDEFTMDKINDDIFVDLINRIRVYIDEECRDARLGCSRVKIVTWDGREYISKVDKPRGYPENPLTKDELINKFRILASKTLDEEAINEIIYVVDNLEEYGIRDLAGLASACKE